MLKWISTVDWQSTGGSRFVTLTYPDCLIETTYKDRATQRYLFHRKVEECTENRVPMLWRTEWTLRKSGEYVGKLMPHHHLLLFSVGYLSNSVVREWWRKILGHDGTVSTDVRACPEGSKVSYYVAKYSAKPPHLDIQPYLNNMLYTGRQWGVCRRQGVPMEARICSRLLTEGEVALAKQLGKDVSSRYGEFGEGGFTVLGDDRVCVVKRIFADALALKAKAE